MIFLIAPFFLQGILMFFDEFYFHHRRGLPAWERIGHPLDTLSVLACFAFLVFYVPTEMNLKIYIGLCIFSSLFITKDEFIHAKKCAGGEHWLHSSLFILHPVVFFMGGLMWMRQIHLDLLVGQSFALIIFMIYQVIYWSLREKSQQ